MFLLYGCSSFAKDIEPAMALSSHVLGSLGLKSWRQVNGGNGRISVPHQSSHD